MLKITPIYLNTMYTSPRNKKKKSTLVYPKHADDFLCLGEVKLFLYLWDKQNELVTTYYKKAYFYPEKS